MYTTDTIKTSGEDLKITFLCHGTLMFTFGSIVLHVDPVSDMADYSTLPKADIILVTHEHYDHFDTKAIEMLRKQGTVIIASESCTQQLGDCIVMKNNEVKTLQGLTIEAVPAYNIAHMRSPGNPFHPKGVGNGYVITFNDTKVYVAADTENIPEMKELSGIDVAFLPMNLPYTMTPEMVADTARMFNPKILYPYHFGETNTSELVDSFDFIDKAKIQIVRIDANDPNALASKMDEKFDVVLDFLPPQCIRTVAEAAIKSGVNLVNTNYAYDILDLDHAAKERGISIIPECGLDPGIDLIIYNYSLKYFDEVFKLNSYCGGIPEKAACDNPLKYKISWNINAVLKSQIRDATLIADSEIIFIPAKDQHENAFIHHIEFPELGTLEAIPNGNAVYYAKLLKIEEKLCETGRYTLRWPGWCAFWNPMKKLGFLSDVPIKGLPYEISPFEMVAKLLEPQLQYNDNEKDLCVMVNKVEGVREGKQQILTCSLMIERDLMTGLMAMSMGVAYPACIAAEMIVKGDITRKGVLSPATDVPCDLFMDRLNKKGIRVNETIEQPI